VGYIVQYSTITVPVKRAVQRETMAVAVTISISILKYWKQLLAGPLQRRASIWTVPPAITFAEINNDSNRTYGIPRQMSVRCVMSLAGRPGTKFSLKIYTRDRGHPKAKNLNLW